MNSIFSFPADKFPELAKFLASAEKHKQSDHDLCLENLAFFVEGVVGHIFKIDNTPRLCQKS